MFPVMLHPILQGYIDIVFVATGQTPPRLPAEARPASEGERGPARSAPREAHGRASILRLAGRAILALVARPRRPEADATPVLQGCG